jgi:hypothetical protein
MIIENFGAVYSWIRLIPCLTTAVSCSAGSGGANKECCGCVVAGFAGFPVSEIAITIVPKNVFIQRKNQP